MMLAPRPTFASSAAPVNAPAFEGESLGELRELLRKRSCSGHVARHLAESLDFANSLEGVDWAYSSDDFPKGLISRKGQGLPRALKDDPSETSCQGVSDVTPVVEYEPTPKRSSVDSSHVAPVESMVPSLWSLSRGHRLERLAMDAEASYLSAQRAARIRDASLMRNSDREADLVSALLRAERSTLTDEDLRSSLISKLHLNELECMKHEDSDASVRKAEYMRLALERSAMANEDRTAAFLSSSIAEHKKLVQMARKCAIKLVDSRVSHCVSLLSAAVYAQSVARVTLTGFNVKAVRLAATLAASIARSTLAAKEAVQLQIQRAQRQERVAKIEAFLDSLGTRSDLHKEDGDLGDSDLELIAFFESSDSSSIVDQAYSERFVELRESRENHSDDLPKSVIVSDRVDYKLPTPDIPLQDVLDYAAFAAEQSAACLNDISSVSPETRSEKESSYNSMWAEHMQPKRAERSSFRHHVRNSLWRRGFKA